MLRVVVVYDVSEHDGDALAKTLYWDALLNQEHAFNCNLVKIAIQDSSTGEWRSPRNDSE